jgi:hypothetical protein
MSMLHRLIGAAPLALAVLLAGCGGGTTATQQAVAVQSSSVQPVPQAIDTAAFVKMAQGEASCADLRNRLWVIDDKEVYWDRAGSKCADNNWSQKLYGTNTGTVLCSAVDSIAGPQVTCANDTVRALFDTIRKFGNAPNLGLDASHKVEPIAFPPPAGTDIKFTVLVKSTISGIKDTRNVVIKDQAAWEQLWKAHTSTMTAAPAVPYIDFSRQMVLGAFAGEGKLSCGSDMAIAHVGAQEGKLVVDVEERVFPRPEVCLAMVTQPMQLVLVDRVDVPVEFVKHTVSLVNSVVLDSSKQSGVHVARNVVVKDEASWAALWAEHAGKDRAAPTVDFTRQMVIAVFLGDLYQPCYNMRFDNVTSDTRQLTLRYTIVPPPMGMMCTMNVATMATLVAVDRSDLPVAVVRDTTVPANL